jgi:hypothetical protein
MTFMQRVRLKIRLMTWGERAVWALEVAWCDMINPIGWAVTRLMTQLGCMLVFLVYTSPPAPELWPMILRISLVIWIVGEAIVSVFSGHPRKLMPAVFVVFVATLFAPSMPS